MDTMKEDKNIGFLVYTERGECFVDGTNVYQIIDGNHVLVGKNEFTYNQEERAHYGKIVFFEKKEL